MRRFRLDSIDEIIADVPNVGRLERTTCVAQGVVFHDGTVALRWMSKSPSTAVCGDLAAFRAIHHVIPKPEDHRERCGQPGQRYIRWADPICFRCGAVLWLNEIEARHCFGCGAGQGEELHYADNPDPSLGSWGPAVVINGETP